jgi:hypothetical protein
MFSPKASYVGWTVSLQSSGVENCLESGLRMHYIPQQEGADHPYLELSAPHPSVLTQTALHGTMALYNYVKPRPYERKETE